MQPRVFLMVGALALTGCGGAANSVPVPAPAQVETGTPLPSNTTVTAALTITVPRAAQSGRRRASIFPETQSVGIIINNQLPGQYFNLTPSSPNCSSTPTGTSCTLTLGVPVGTDDIAVATFSGPGGSGTPLNAGQTTQNMLAGASNAVGISLNPVVSNLNDGGLGSLRQAVAEASPGDTIVFVDFSTSAKFAGTIGLFTFMLFLFVRFLPMIPAFEINEMLSHARPGEHKA